MANIKEKIQKKCLFCENHFTVSPSLQRIKFCSKKCVDSYKSNGFTANCQNCGKVFSIQPSRKNTAKFCSKECQTVKIEKECLTCGKHYFVRPCHSDSTFCNKNCKRHSADTKQKLSELTKTQMLSPESRDKAREFAKLSKGSKGHNKLNNLKISASAKVRSEKLKGKIPAAFKKQWEFSKTAEGRKQNSERAKKFYAANPEKHMNFILGQKGFESSLEKKMRLALESKQISFEKQFRIDRFWTDFAIPSSRLVIEVDGEHWHQDKEKDAKRDEIIKSYGWHVVRFSGKQVVNSIDSCIAEVEKIITIL